MGKRIALCIDEQSCRNPGLVGLEGENLEMQPWLDLYFDGQSARSAIRCENGLGEAWVVSCDDVEAINLAATLKADCPELVVRLVDFEGGGSLLNGLEELITSKTGISAVTAEDPMTAVAIGTGKYVEFLSDKGALSDF